MISVLEPGRAAMLSIEDCLVRALMALNERSTESYGIPDGWASEQPVCEITDHRLAPGHVLVAYDAAPDPQTGRQSPLAGNVPIAINRRTGDVLDDRLGILMEHWPETCLRSHAEMWLAADTNRAVINLARPRSDVVVVEAARAICMGWSMRMLQAKAIVESAIKHGTADFEIGGWAENLRSGVRRARARATCDRLERAGVRLEIKGTRLSAILDFFDLPSPPR
jgi:hypothetical protein